MSEQKELQEVIESFGGQEVSPMVVYSDIFELGYGRVQRTGEESDKKPNPIILGAFNGKIERQIMLEDTFYEQLEHFWGADWAILNGVTYWGRRNTANGQGQLCALIFDLDGVTRDTLYAFLSAAHGDAWDGHGAYPIPNYIVLSGENVHLYYLMDNPITLYPKNKIELKKLKFALTTLMWNPYTSKEKKPQYQGLNQGFRVIGGKTKKGGLTRALRLSQTPFSVAELNEYVPEKDQADVNDDIKSTKYTLAEAKELYPEWYERVILHKQKYWTVKEDLYKWWLRRLQSCDGVTFRHRYFTVMALAIFAAKCGILDRERVKKDAMTLIPSYTQINPDFPFYENDIDCALECLDLRFCTFPRKDIEKITGIPMPPNKRNGRAQEQHLARIRVLQEFDYPDGSWRNTSGRPKGAKNKKYPKRDQIRDYKQKHPEATQREIAKALGISPTTVNKWLKND